MNKWKPNIVSDRYATRAFKDVFCIDIMLNDLSSVQCLTIKYIFSEKIAHYNNFIKKTKYGGFFRAVIFQFEIKILIFVTFSTSYEIA